MNRTSERKTYEEALEKIKDICASREMSPSEVSTLLKRWGLASEKIQEITEKLKTEKFLDESRYAFAFVRDKIRLERWGLYKVKFALKQKGIPGPIAEEAIQSVDETEYREMVQSELLKKAKLMKGSSAQNWQKLARFGSSRGYEMEIMHDMLDEICRKTKGNR
ncbi:MAG: RecX family transcriptional regulator [Bacteroidales bacterium]|nr:RecX family transcriptional regulator [Bacteroidales bacterium]